jgi:hypothetical protein
MKITELTTESVAGPKNCWPGYRKTGTQPGTGKNAGKRVNDCEKIKEQGVADDSVGLAEDFEWVYILNGKDVTDELNEENRKQAEKEMCKHFLQMIEDARNDFI